MSRYITFLATLILAAICVAATPILELKNETGYTVRGLSGRIRDLQYADYDKDGVFELLATSYRDLVVYSPKNDSILFHADMDSTASYRILFSDVTHDSIPDIVLQATRSDRYHLTIVITVFDGSTNFQFSYCDSSTGHGYGYYGPHATVLYCTDIDGDGYQELIVPTDDVIESINSPNVTYSGPGYCICYDHFPASVAWRLNAYLLNLQQVETGPGQIAVVGTACAYYSSQLMYPGPGPSYSSYYASVGRLESNGTVPTLVAMPGIDGCNWYRYGNSNSVSFLSSGQILGSPSTRELLVSQHAAFANLEFNPGCESSVFDSLFLFQFVEADSLVRVWGRGSGCNGSYFHPKLPGYLLGIYGSYLDMFNGVDGSLVSSIAVVPNGTREWHNIAGDGDPKLIAVVDSSISVYRLDIRVDVTEPEYDRNLPSDFSLSCAYTNPFNNSVNLVVSTAGKTEMRVSIFNLLGEQVDELLNATVSAGSHRLSRDAAGFPSGVYLIRASTHEATRTAKVVMIK